MALRHHRIGRFGHSRRYRRYRRASAFTALAAVAIAMPITAGCSAVEKAIDCAQLAVDITTDVDDLQDAVGGAVVDPQDADKILDALDKDIDKIKDKTDNADVGKAVDDLQKAVDNVQTAIDKGQDPDLTPVKDAAGELTKVCSP
ncbi:secreted protein [Streptomyces bingchenggensis BCW-1]|uniref:Secreted protein n=1 Tax=Streptomyces bingchenggensis (strain BCW-1) TaxID=749414 RepID=D7BXR1_STRBB|nr:MULTISPECIES: hypothetical protein [Streptomyces]ADI09809.1 secreted protein [Streptomyces bingchenggensis BCW-1]